MALPNLVWRSLLLLACLVAATHAEDYDGNDYNAYYEGDDYIKYWTDYAILPKRCIVQ